MNIIPWGCLLQMRIFSNIQKLTGLSYKLIVDLRCKRDDMLPMPGGGNKVRKCVRIIKKTSQLGCNALVTTGGIQSNHARVVSMLAAEKGWPCKLVLHGNPAELKNPKGNLFLMILSGADIDIVSPDNIGSTMKGAMEDLKRSGYNSFEVPGGGHCLEGALAYFDAVNELKGQCKNLDWQPDWIIHASGTGATQAGIATGIYAIGWKTKVLGISVARKNPRGKNVVEQSCKEIGQYLKLDLGNHFQIDFRDDWVGAGYEKADESIFSTIRLAAKTEGLILDPTYTGKAFTAMLDLIKSGEIKNGSRVLFWHTGGLLNLTSSDYIGDILQI